MTLIQQFEEDLQKNKANCFAAKLGIIDICWNCRKPICFTVNWVHTEYPYTNERACWTSMDDGYAIPMDKEDLDDWYDDLMEMENE